MAAIDSWNTSSPTSASSSTSDPAPRARVRLAGWVRLTHPFPSVLDGLVCVAMVVLAGRGPVLALTVGASMTLIQLGIGTVNDIVDAPRDAGRKAGKPIPDGLVGVSAARLGAVVLFASGTALAFIIGMSLAVLGLVVIGIGLAYDLRLKGTAWSWLPFAVGIPVLPIYGWLGAAASFPAAFAVLLPAATASGAALAIGNALVDVERDRAAGITSIALALGPRRAGRVGTALIAGVWLAAVLSSAVMGAASVGVAIVALAGAIPVAAAVAGGASSSTRERAWQAQAVGLAVLAIAWLAAVAAGGGRA